MAQKLSPSFSSSALFNKAGESVLAIAEKGSGYGIRHLQGYRFLPRVLDQANRLRKEYSVYMLDSSRINVAGVNASNIEYLAEAVAKVL